MNNSLVFKNQRLLATLIAVGIIVFGIGNWIVKRRENRISLIATRIAADAVIHPRTSKVGLKNDAEERITSAIKAKFWRLVVAGARAYFSVDIYLRWAVATGDQSEISRAFSKATFGRFWSWHNVIPALRSYGNDPDGFVRLNAGQNLLKVGDKSGYAILLALVQLNSPIAGPIGDVRIDASESLAQIRQRDASPAIYNLYKQTNDPRLIRPLVIIGNSGATDEL